MRLKIFFTILLFLISNFSFSQLIRLRCTHFSSRSINNSGYWSKWSDWTNSGVLVTMNSEVQRVTIYSEIHQTYDMIEQITESNDSEGNPIHTVACLDENGTRCKMVWYYRKDDDSNYLILSFSNIELMYKVNRITD